MSQPYAHDDQQRQRQQEWRAGTRRVYADEVDYGGTAGAQAGAGRGGRVLSGDKAGVPRWKENGPLARAMVEG